MTPTASPEAQALFVRRWSIIFVLLAVTVLAYLPAFENGLTNWDDNDYVSGNPYFGSLSFEALKAIFSGYFKGNYHPLTLLSLAFDDGLARAFGGSVGASVRVHHAVSIALHALDTALVFLCVEALTRRTRGPLLPAVTALLFGLHPLHVESVAWISARKDVLHAAFYLGALLSYIRFARVEGAAGSRAYVASLLLFVCALLSKGMAVTLAPTLVALDWALGRRLGSRAVLLEKLPFFALALVFGLIAIAAQSAAGQLAGESLWAPHERVALAAHATLQYVRLFLLPLGLSAFYPYPGSIGAVHVVSALTLVAAGLALAALLRRRRLPAFALLFFALNISVVLQLVPVGGALYADRYAYVPSIGLCLAFALAIDWAIGCGTGARVAAIALLGLYVVGLSYATGQRCLVWRDSLSLWDATLALYPEIPSARLNRALARLEAGDPEGAEYDLSEAIRLDPKDAKAYSYRGVVRHTSGRTELALADLDRAIVLSPSSARYANRGSVRLASGNVTGALIDFDRAIALDPGAITAYHNRGLARAEQARWPEAISDYGIAIALHPGYGQAHLSRARALIAIGENEAGCTDLLMAGQLGMVDAAPLSARHCGPGASN